MSFRSFQEPRKHEEQHAKTTVRRKKLTAYGHAITQFGSFFSGLYSRDGKKGKKQIVVGLAE